MLKGDSGIEQKFNYDTNRDKDIQNSLEQTNVNTNSNTSVNSRPPPQLVNNSKHNEEDFEFSMDHITSMVDNLGGDSDEEELARHETISQPQIGQSSQMDPSILFAQKAEPGKNVNGLHNWIYRDPQGEIQGKRRKKEIKIFVLIVLSIFLDIRYSFRT